MNIPKTKLESYLEFRQAEADLHLLRLGEGADASLLDEARQRRDRCRALLFDEDSHSFESLEELRIFFNDLQSQGWAIPDHVIDEIISHESDHADVALAMGHRVTFHTWILDGSNDGSPKIAWAPYTRVTTDETFSLEDLREIAGAPDNLSDIDNLFQ